MSSNNIIHQVGFKVRKYGSKAEIDNKLLNVFEDTVFEAETFEFE